MLSAERPGMIRGTHEHCLVNGQWQCRAVARPRRKKVRRNVGVFTNRHDSGTQFDNNSRWAATDSDFAGSMPALAEFLTERLDEEGRARITSTLLILCEDGLWKACLTDRAQSGSNFDYRLWKSGATLNESLRALDTALQESTAEWRKNPKWQAQKRR